MTHRDALAEALWLEPGLLRKPWAEWDRTVPDETERVRMRADHLMRLLDRMGFAVVATGEPAPPPPAPAAGIFWRYPVAGAERVLRADGDGYMFAKVDAGTESQLMRFGMAEAYDDSGRIMTGDHTILKQPGVLTRQACALEIHRVHAFGVKP